MYLVQYKLAKEKKRNTVIVKLNPVHYREQKTLEDSKKYAEQLKEKYPLISPNGFKTDLLEIKIFQETN